ncbi:MAG: hypothetical protein RI963_2381 [Planctomycetota bacterium]
MENGNAKRTTGVGSGTPHEHAASKPKPTREHKRHQITVNDGEAPNRRAATIGFNPHRHLKRKSATERKELLPKKTKRARKIAPTRSALPDSTESINDLPHALRNDPTKKITSPDQLANPTPEIWRKSSCRHQPPTIQAGFRSVTTRTDEIILGFWRRYPIRGTGQNAWSTRTKTTAKRPKFPNSSVNASVQNQRKEPVADGPFSVRPKPARSR